MGSRLIIAGSRSITDYEKVKIILDQYLIKIQIIEIIHGGARGVDTLAEQYAKNNNIPTQVFLPNYQGKNDRSAPLRRNIEMANYGDILIAFHDGISKGTIHMINEMLKLGKRTYVHVI